MKINAEFVEAMESVQNMLLIQLATKMFVTSTREKKRICVFVRHLNQHNCTVSVTFSLAVLSYGGI